MGMMRIINRKKYDTSTAKLCGEDSYGYTNDFSYWIERLYLKSTGEYFLYGEGGPHFMWDGCRLLSQPKKYKILWSSTLAYVGGPQDVVSCIDKKRDCCH